MSGLRKSDSGGESKTDRAPAGTGRTEADETASH